MCPAVHECYTNTRMAHVDIRVFVRYSWMALQIRTHPYPACVIAGSIRTHPDERSLMPDAHKGLGYAALPNIRTHSGRAG